MGVPKLTWSKAYFFDLEGDPISIRLFPPISMHYFFQPEQLAVAEMHPACAYELHLSSSLEKHLATLN